MSLFMNVDPNEISKFDEFAKTWWDPNGSMKPLHQLNPLRLDYVQQRATLKDKSILDIGCGGGILSESLAKAGANVTAIDLSADAIKVATEHAKNLNINYRVISAEDLASQKPHHFDTITCMEMLEHVPDPQSILKATFEMLKPGGYAFLSTINRTAKSYLAAIIGAEYILQLLPKGTHEYKKFIKPSELNEAAEAVGFQLINLQGIHYNPLNGKFSFCKSVDINYLACYQKPGEDNQ